MNLHVLHSHPVTCIPLLLYIIHCVLEQSIEITRRGQTSEHGAQVSQQTAKQQQQQQSPDTDSGGGGLFRRWFPGWSGWYQPSPASEASQVAAESPVVPVVQEEEASAMPRPVTSYEEESEIGELPYNSSFHIWCEVHTKQWLKFPTLKLTVQICNTNDILWVLKMYCRCNFL